VLREVRVQLLVVLGALRLALLALADLAPARAISSRTGCGGIAGRRSEEAVPGKERRFSVTSADEILKSLVSMLEVAPWRMKNSSWRERLLR
jgi:hypothetical protein